MIHPKTSTKVIGQDRIDRLRKELSKFKDAYVTIGIHQDAGKYTKGSTPPDVVQVALWQEFGTATIPQRSFVRSAIDENESKINQWRDEMISNIVENGWTIQKALSAIGMRIQLLIQNKIKSNVPPRLASSTAKGKERRGVAPVTLIDTGLLLRSVSYKVVLE